MTTLKFIACLTGSLLLFQAGSLAQCRSLAKKQCFPLLTPYTQNGEFNSVRIAPGESAETQIIFYAGQNYRLIVCSEGVLGDVQFKVTNSEKEVLFNSAKSENKQWDFNLTATQPLNILVEVPASASSNKIIPEGCVSILVGVKKL